MPQGNYCIRQERPADYRKVEQLTREAFWNVYRPGCTEHYILHQFRTRDDFVPELDLVLEREGEIIGHIMYARAEITADNGRRVPVMTFGPISIAPHCQRQGWGTLLLRHSMALAKALGAGALCIEGNIAFYGKSGFVVAGSRGIRYHAEPERESIPYFLLCELQDGFLAGVRGVYHTPAGYFVDEAEAERFDAAFPPKTKRKLPGQLI